MIKIALILILISNLANSAEITNVSTTYEFFMMPYDFNDWRFNCDSY